jgi:hypothetical protein
MRKRDIIVDSTIGKAKLDGQGAAIGAVRMNPALSYSEIPALLKEVIDQGSSRAWADIKARIDYTCKCLGHALKALDEEIAFSREVKARVAKGQKLLFKPNLVTPVTLDPFTHAPVNIAVCTPWAFIAALMRWFHDKLGITYHQMSLGEAATTMSATAGTFTRALGGKGVITTQAVMEGRSGDFYGGWGFYFVRKYLADSHKPDHSDDPMNGYEESVSGTCLPPGRANNKLMVYDLNKVDDDRSDGRDVPVPHGVNYQTITLHKAIVGGDPGNPKDRADWPGCVLINVPKLKVHQLELLTNAIKNLGIGLYPMEVNISNEPGKLRWKYAEPDRPMPGLKSKLPHSVWVGEADEETGMPLRDKDGQYVVGRTGGMEATMADVIEAVQVQDIYMLHVIDGIEATNIMQAGPTATGVPEGYVFASADPVAVDVLSARYLFTTVPMAEARKVQKERNLPADFLQKVPIPKSDGRNIITREGYDSPIPRYRAFPYCQDRGLGQQDYYVVGRDEWQGGRLASLAQHLGRVEGDKFSELLTGHMYYSAFKVLWDLQATTFAYAEANDSLTGSSYRQALLDDYDENGDGVIDYSEKGKNASFGLAGYAPRLQAMDIDQLEVLRIRFLMNTLLLRYINRDWNPDRHDFGRRGQVNMAVALAMRMSQEPAETTDPLFPGMTWGKGKWPSIQSALHFQLCNRIYGVGFPNQFDILMAPYGQAFRYADLKWNGGKYSGAEGLLMENDAIGKYHRAVAQGAAPLPFVMYVPSGYGRAANGKIPNVEETGDPSLMFTTSFDNGRETWRELSLSSIP